MGLGIQDSVVVVLVRARNPANIGAVARAMHDFGYARLRVVNEFPVPFAAAKSAVDASSVLAAATEPTSVAEAVADCTLVLGTTAVGERVLEHPLYALEEAAGFVAGHLGGPAGGKVALLFGSEKTGLSNEELSHCHALLTIPMNAPEGSKHLSMNLGQAAAVCLYRLARGEDLGRDGTQVSEARRGAPRSLPVEVQEEVPARAADLERLTGLLREVLERSGYARRHPANAREAVVRRLVRRMALHAPDAAVWTGMLRQMLHGLPGSAKAGDDDGNVN
jgi:tRNA/rRNA methyltransferase